MITLCGMAISNYYNKVKLALLEKGIAFEEEYVKTGSKDEAVLACSPLGKVPFLRTPHGPLCESEAIMGYLEAIQPNPPLLPADPYASAKVRELSIFVDLHLELVARELYTQAFFGGTVGEDTKASVRKRLRRNIPAFKRLARFAPYVAGDTFTQADCAAWPHLPLVGMATRLVFGEDMLLGQGVDWKGYAAFIGQRPHAAKVAADRKAAQERLSKA
jgi:glutathione S-transferase